MVLNFKRNYPIVLVLVVVIAILIVGLGDLRVIAYTTQPAAGTVAQEQNANDIKNDVALFEYNLVHSIQVIMDQDDYHEMLSSYQNSGLKDYYKADVMIDGVWINEVGIRLKGNASLRSALGGGMAGGRPGDNQPPGKMDGMEKPPRPEEGERPGMPAEREGLQRTPGEVFPGAPGGVWLPQPPANFSEQAAQGGERDAGPGQGGPVASEQAQIPFLIKFNEYVVGQTYQGHSKLSIRTYGASYDAAMLQEPLTNLVAQLAGLPATQTAYAGFSINDSDESLYVISELVDDEYYLGQYFKNPNGILYKAELGSTLRYAGEDPSSYARSFSQETRLNQADLAPLITFLRFLDQSDETTFESDLPQHFDVDAFATYLAVNALLVNTDSIIGMNNNYYLYYDDSNERFTLLMWDANESLGKLGGSASYDLYFSNPGGGPGGNRGGGGMGGAGSSQNVLLQRSMASATFKELYEQKVKEVYQQAFASGAMLAEIERISALIHETNDEHSFVDIDAYDQAVQKTLVFINQRTEYLETTDLLGE